jgi:hypothetical protein
MVGVFQLVLNLFVELFHGRRARGILRVDEHWRGKIVLGKHSHDVPEVHSNFVPRGRVIRSVGFHFDRPAVGVKAEMVSGFIMGEAHDVITPLDHALLVVILSCGLGLRRGSCGAKRKENGEQKRVHDGNPFEYESTSLDGRDAESWLPTPAKCGQEQGQASGLSLALTWSANS